MTASQISPKLSRGKQPFIVLCGSGIRTVHSRASLALLWDVWGLRWKNRKLGAGITCRLIHSRVWWLMLVVDWDLSCGCRLEPIYVASSCHLASSQNDGWISKVSIPRESQWKLYCLLCPSLGNHSVTSTVLYLLRKLVSERGTQTSPLEGGVSVSHWRKNMWNGYVLVHLLKKTTFYRHGDDN